MTGIMVTRWALVAGMMATLAAPALAQDRTAISLDRLTQDVITNNPERQFYQRHIETAGTEARAAGRWADPELVVEFGERRADDRLSGAPIGEGQTYAVSVVQPIEFGGRIALRRAIAERQIGLARIGLQQFDATLTARAGSLGYVLERGFDMPPLMLTSDEVEAVVLGAQWVLVHADEGLARAAADVLAKVAAIVPEQLRGQIEDPAVITPPKWNERLDAGVDVARLRAWSLQGRKLHIRYADEGGRETERTVWPFLVGYMDRVRMLIAWCELRGDFRMFRTDRLAAIEFRDERYPERRAALRRRWLTMMSERPDVGATQNRAG